MGELKSRNGKLLEEVFEAQNLGVLNRSDKCHGMITRQSGSEKSAIDFIVAEPQIEECIESMIIDEDGIYKIKGEKSTDHNTIVLNMSIQKMDKTKAPKKTQWRIHAPEQSWQKLRIELAKHEEKLTKLLENPNWSMDEKYTKWYRLFEKAARSTIGKTTVKSKGKEQFSERVKELRKQKRVVKKCLKNDDIDKSQVLTQYGEIQTSLRNQILKERTEKTNQQWKKMTEDKSKVVFWKERKRLKRNETNECLTVKNEDGIRQFDPDKIKHTVAAYYEKLYAKKDVRHHPHHEIVKEQIKEFEMDTTKDNEWYNEIPTAGEIREIIENKKNGKASTDIKNEIIKNGKEQFIRIFMPLVTEVWKTEKVPTTWNEGSITTIWKGKGDQEQLTNHRGITVSSGLGSIVEELIDRRAEKIVKFSRGQAGGKKGASTADHLFLLRGLMTLAIEKGENLFLTFFDVEKAYDNADIDNMLHIIWLAGLQGKIWRIVRGLSTNLTATVKTRYGPSRPIARENGGKQGSRLTGRLFAKQIDTFSDESISNNVECVKVNSDLSIGCLEFVDDVLSSTNGLKNQLSILKKADEFAKKNKLTWGEKKCQVMQIGKKVKVPEKWQLGDKNIQNTTSYKYLGEMITNNNKNKSNLEAKENKVQAIVRQINTTAASDVMRGIETKVILELFEKCILPSLLNNCESWTLSPSDELQIEKITITAIKRLFSLPTTTPTAAIIFSLGLLYTTQSVDQKRFLYLHKLLNLENDHWNKQMLLHLHTTNSGWAKNIILKLTEYGLESNWDTIKTKTKNEWRASVNKAVNERNKNRLIENCTTKTTTGIKINTKTKETHTRLTSEQYNRQPLQELHHGNKQRTKTIILARHRMLECGKNYKGTMSERCRSCKVTDDENHRLNECTMFDNASLNPECNFDDIYSTENDVIDNIVRRLEKVWELRYANGRMRK